MNKKKVFIIIGIVMIILLFGIFVYNFFKVKNAKVEVILVDNLEANFADTLKVSSFIESINGNILNDYIIDTKNLGKKTIKFEYVNNDKIMCENYENNSICYIKGKYDLDKVVLINKYLKQKIVMVIKQKKILL